MAHITLHRCHWWGGGRGDGHMAICEEHKGAKHKSWVSSFIPVHAPHCGRKSAQFWWKDGSLPQCLTLIPWPSPHTMLFPGFLCKDKWSINPTNQWHHVHRFHTSQLWTSIPVYLIAVSLHTQLVHEHSATCMGCWMSSQAVSHVVSTSVFRSLTSANLLKCW